MNDLSSRTGLRMLSGASLIVKVALCLAGLAVMAAQPGCHRKSKSESVAEREEAKPPRPPRQPDVPAVDEPRPVSELNERDLIRCLGHEDWHKRLEATESLVALGGDVIPALIEALEDENYHVRAGAAFALGQFGSDAEAAIEPLEKVVREDDRDAVRSAAEFAMAAIRGN